MLPSLSIISDYLFAFIIVNMIFGFQNDLNYKNIELRQKNILDNLKILKQKIERFKSINSTMNGYQSLSVRMIYFVS